MIQQLSLRAKSHDMNPHFHYKLYSIDAFNAQAKANRQQELLDALARRIQ